MVPQLTWLMRDRSSAAKLQFWVLAAEKGSEMLKVPRLALAFQPRAPDERDRRDFSYHFWKFGDWNV
jgi:hypothetical protein